MPSLIKKLFDTMPLKGVLGAVTKRIGAAQPATLGQVRRHVTVFRTPPAIKEEAFASTSWKGPNDTPIWGWTALRDPSRVEELTCRVRDASFANHLVLSSLEYGSASIDDPKTFRKSVAVVFNGKTVELPLTQEYHFLSFITRGGYINADNTADFWPLESYHDPSLLHVFAYDVDRVKGTVIALTSPTHPDKKNVDATMRRLEEIGLAAEDDSRTVDDIVFNDNLWNPTPSNTPPTAKVPGPAVLTLDAVRILVACSMTACRERDDFQPGKLGGVGRMYPHVMVIATSTLDRVDAALRFRRPAVTTMLDHGLDPHAAHHQSEHDEMLPPIKSLLIADANKGNVVLGEPPRAPGPLPYWASMFTYYSVDPYTDPKIGDKLLPVVRRAKPLTRNRIGGVDRDCWDVAYSDEKDGGTGLTNRMRVLKRERQGYFDNIHIAPRMRVKDPIESVDLYLPGPPPKRAYAHATADKAAWKMNEVTMAPFCAHDCFHMHWRWSDNHNAEPGTWGWGPVKSHTEVGRAMVPENQDVYIQLLGHGEFSYISQAHEVPKDVWQPFCHHGSAYAVRVGNPMDIARRTVHHLDEMTFNVNGSILPADGDGWALFYWRLRYRLVPTGGKTVGQYTSVALEERFSWKDEDWTLDL